MLFHKPEYFGLFVCLFGGIAVLSLSGCQRHDNSPEDNLDPVLLNSSELEQYIIAGVEYEHALNTFQAEISKIDFSKLEFKEDLDGGQVMRLSMSVSMEAKAVILDEKKSTFFGKYPQFASFTDDVKESYFRICIKNSVNVNSRLLELGINIYLPLTKGGTTEQFSNLEDLVNYLAAEMSKSDYKEIVIIVYKDGRIATYQDDENSADSFKISIPYTGTATDGKFYYPQAQDRNGNIITRNEISFIAHTHKSGIKPSEKDKTKAAQWPGLPQAIYYDGDMKIFNR